MSRDAERKDRRPTSKSFRASTPVVAKTRWIGPGKIPLFGETNEWDLTGLGRPANRYKSWGVISFAGLSPHFNLMAREIAICMLHPMSRQVRDQGVFLPDKPSAPSPVARAITFVRFLQHHATAAELSDKLGLWSVDDLRGAVDAFGANGRRPAPTAEFAIWLALVQRLRPVLSSGYPKHSVWTSPERKRWNSLANKASAGLVKETPMTPELFYPLANAAVAYVDNFSEDILAARRNLDEMLRKKKGPRHTITDDEIVRRLQAPYLVIPLHSGGRFPRGEPNYSLLSLTISAGRTSQIFSSSNEGTRERRRALVQPFLLEPGKTQIGAFHIRATGFRDRCEDLWHEPFDAENLHEEVYSLRTACYIVLAITTLMRDNEIQAIQRGSLATYYGAPAIRSVLRKGRPQPEESYWWLHPLGAKAISVAEQLSTHETHIFSVLRDMSGAGSPYSDGTGFAALYSLDKFIAHVNRNTGSTGLAMIPTNEKALPRKFRRTMAVQVGQQPGGELALGVILKHVHARAIGNASTIGYATPSAPWMLEYESERVEASLEAIISRWDQDPLKHRAVSGPGADSYNEGFDAVAASANAPHVADRSQRVALIKGAMPGLRFGTFNHCLGDLSKARCLSRTTGQSQIDSFRCQPSKCGNSVITAEHVQFLQSEKRDLEKMLKEPKISESNQRILLERKSVVEALLPREGQTHGC